MQSARHEWFFKLLLHICHKWHNLPSPKKEFYILVKILGDEKILKYKFDPFYGFVEAKKEGEEETKEDDLFKFVPYYGFVPVNDEDPQKQTSLHHLQYTFHPYHGYMPTLIETEDKKEETLYKFDHLLGFVPAEKETEAAEDVAEVEGMVAQI